MLLIKLIFLLIIHIFTVTFFIKINENTVKSTKNIYHLYQGFVDPYLYLLLYR